jgi:hypothetical protein
MKAAQVKTMLLSLFVLCVLDGLCTLFLVNYGYTTEFNPIMSEALSYGEFSFVFMKAALTTLGVVCLWQNRYEEAAQIVTWGLVLIMAIVVGIQFWMFGSVLLEKL